MISFIFFIERLIIIFGLLSIFTKHNNNSDNNNNNNNKNNNINNNNINFVANQVHNEIQYKIPFQMDFLLRVNLCLDVKIGSTIRLWFKKNFHFESGILRMTYNFDS